VLAPRLSQSIAQARVVGAQLAHGEDRQGVGPEQLVPHAVERDAHASHPLAGWLGRPALVGGRVGETLAFSEQPRRLNADAMAIEVRPDAVWCHRAFPSAFPIGASSPWSRGNI